MGNKYIVVFVLSCFLSISGCRDVVYAFQQPDAAITAMKNSFPPQNDTVPGGVLTISKAGKDWFSTSYGMADLEHQAANKAETIFEAGSVSKQFTAAAVLLLVTEGRLGLKDDVRRYISELPDYGKTITIENLLTHTSGIKDWGTVAIMSGWPRATRIYTQKQVYDLIFRQKTLNFLPGTDFAYSNSNYNLLVLLVERVTGEKFVEFTRTRIFQRAGLKHTSWRTSFRTIVPNRAIAYKKEGNKQVMFMPFEDTYGHAALLTTASDLIRWNNELAKGCFGEEFERLRLRQFLLPNGNKTEYACGALFIRKVNGFLEICHTGSTAGYRSWLAYYPEKNVSVAYLSNDASVPSISIARKVSDILLGGKRVPSSSQNPEPVLGERSAASAGIYKNVNGPQIIELSFQGDSLYLRRDPEWNSMYNDPWKIGARQFRLMSDRVLQVKTPHTTQIYTKTRQADATDKRDLTAFTGAFYSEECGVGISVTKMNNGLALQFENGVTFNLRPVYKSEKSIAYITENNILIEFMLDAKKQITGFSAHLSQEEYVSARADNLVFIKTTNIY